jgi:hypothetical protein
MLIAAALLLSTTLATVTVFDVQAGQAVQTQLSLAVDDHVVIKVSVLGDEGESTLDFFLNYPDGTVMRAFPQTGSVDYPFVCTVEGQYTLNFSDVAYTHNKHITLDYEVEHYIFGMPQMFFLAVIVAIMCVAAVAVYVLMGRQH